MEKSAIIILFFITLIIQPSFSQNDTIVADNIYEKGKNLYYDGEYLEAREVLEEALDLKQKVWGENHPEVARVWARMGKNEGKLRNHSAALEYLGEGLRIISESKGKEDERVADFHYDIGAIHSQMYNPEKANQHFNKSLEIYKKKFGDKSEDVAYVYMNFGINSTKMGKYYDAGRYYENAFDIFKEISKPESKEMYRIYSNYGVLFRKTGNYDRAIDFANKALKIKLLHYDSLHPSVAKYYGNIARIHSEKGEHQKALENVRKTLAIYENSLGREHPETAGAYGELGNVYADMGLHKKSLKNYKKAIKILEKKLTPTHPYLVGGYMNVGHVYEGMEEYDKALEWYGEAIRKFQAAEYVPGNLVARTQRRIAEVYHNKGDTEQALQIITDALGQIAINSKFNKEDWDSNPLLEETQSEVMFLRLLYSKSKFLEDKHKISQQINELKSAFTSIELAIETIDKLRKRYQSQSAKEFLNSNTVGYYQRAVTQAYQLYRITGEKNYLYKAFLYAEKSKASVLWQQMNEQFALEQANISTRVINELSKIQQQILEHPDDMGQQGGAFELRREYENLISKIEKENPAYYQMKYAPAVIRAEELAAKITDKKQALIEYYYTHNDLYIFIFREGNIQVSFQKINFDLPEAVSYINQGGLESLLSGKPTNHAEYIGHLHQLHDLLIRPIAAEIEDCEHLVIVPHGILQLLPFEMLAPKKTDANFKSLDYLIKKHSIEYAFSAKLWTDRPPIKSNYSKQYLGLAPFVEEDKGIAAVFRDGFAPLPHSGSEIQHGQAFLGGDILLKGAASESAFLQLAPQSRIIHLATHAIANDRSPLESGLLFSLDKDSINNGFLSIMEIYKLRLSAELAVMSACNTGYGQVNEGEGVLSLGRAFMYAGCKSVIMSTWLANDASTSHILKDFYHFSKEGLAKHEALRQAKLRYLETTDPLTAHPYFWANLVAFGDMSPISQKQSTLWWVWIALIALVLLGLTLRFKSKNKTI